MRACVCMRGWVKLGWSSVYIDIDIDVDVDIDIGIAVAGLLDPY